MQHALRFRQEYGVVDLLPADEEIDRAQDPRSTIREIWSRERRGVGDERAGKSIHEMFLAEVERRGCDRTATFAWMKSGRFRAVTEGLIVAAKDGVVHTAAYRHGIIKDGNDSTCRECGTTMETMGHFLAACPSYNLDLYKTRHDAVLNILVGAVAKRLGITVHRNR